MTVAAMKILFFSCSRMIIRQPLAASHNGDIGMIESLGAYRRWKGLEESMGPLRCTLDLLDELFK